jgi:hypothetical protein
MNMLCCLLCYSNIDSHKHFFFECPYSITIWNLACHKAELGHMGSTWDEIIGCFITMTSRSVKNVIARLMLASCVYHI